MDLNSPELVKLRDRIGLLNSGEPREVLQQLTWICEGELSALLINRAIDDVQETKRTDRYPY